MTQKTILLTAIASFVVGTLVGAAITRYRMNIEHRYGILVLDKIQCFGLIRQIEMEPEKIRRSLERTLALRVLNAERSAALKDKVGAEARELLKLVSEHRKNSQIYIEEEKSVRERYHSN